MCVYLCLCFSVRRLQVCHPPGAGRSWSVSSDRLQPAAGVHAWLFHGHPTLSQGQSCLNYCREICESSSVTKHHQGRSVMLHTLYIHISLFWKRLDNVSWNTPILISPVIKKLFSYLTVNAWMFNHTPARKTDWLLGVRKPHRCIFITLVFKWLIYIQFLYYVSNCIKLVNSSFLFVQVEPCQIFS